MSLEDLESSLFLQIHLPLASVIGVEANIIVSGYLDAPSLETILQKTVDKNNFGEFVDYEFMLKFTRNLKTNLTAPSQNYVYPLMMKFYQEQVQNAISDVAVGNALCFLSIFHEKGLGVTVNFDEVIRLCTLSAEKNNAYGQNMLANILYNERKDYKESYRLWLLSATQGYPGAAANLASAYRDGEGVEKNEDEAYRWNLVAAEERYGIVDSLDELAWSYLIKDDYEQAFHWFTLAAKRNSSFAQRCLGNIYSLGDGRPVDHQLALEWFTLAAKNEDPDHEAQYQLGLIYLRGEGVPIDFEEAYKWFESSSEHESSSSYQIGTMFLDGVGKPKDVKKAIEWLEKSEKQNHLGARFKLARIYRWHKEEEYRNFAEALRLYKLLAESGYREARRQLGLIYLQGTGTPIDYEAAFKWLKLAADQGSLNAQHRLALMYIDNEIPATEDKSINTRHEQALKLLMLATKNGKLESFDTIKKLAKKVRTVDLLEMVILAMCTGTNAGTTKMAEGVLHGGVDRLLQLDDEQMTFEFLQAGVDQMYLFSFDFNALTIMSAYAKLQEIKWFMTIGGMTNDYDKWSDTVLPTTLLSIIGSYLPWWSTVTIDPGKLSLHVQLLKFVAVKERKCKKRKLSREPTATLSALSSL